MISARRLRRPLLAFTTLATLGCGPALLAGCSSHASNPSSEPPAQRIPGQHDFVSAPLPGTAAGHGSSFGSAGDNAGATPVAGGTSTSAPAPVQRTVEETDLYRLEGDRLYYLSSYRGLTVFDVTNVDQPKLLGRSPIFGDPVDMIVRNGIAVVVVGDWYGKMDDGTPFHGSIVRGIDARDPSNITITGEAQLGGWVKDTRVVGDVLYAVSEDYAWAYGWDGVYYGGGGGGDAVGVSSGVGSPYGGSTGAKIVISSVNFANGKITSTGSKTFEGYNGIFNVTPTAIMLAHGHAIDPNQPYGSGPGLTDLQYVDISDPAGAIKLRGGITVNSAVNGWGADNGRWNLDFADGLYAHTIGCATQYCYGNQGGYVLSTVDFSNPDAPAIASELPIPSNSWSPAARFDSGRLYLSPSNYYGSGTTSTPIDIYDVTAPKAPKHAGTVQISGNVWLFVPNQGVRLFALGSDYEQGATYSSSKVTLRYLDVTDPASPQVLGTSSFGDGWAWTPAAGTFKAFTNDPAKGMVLIPFSGWDNNSYQYNNGVQLIEYTPTSLTTDGAAKTHGWVERGIFVKNRLVSLSDLALSVVDYTDKKNPKVVTELTLARNVINAQPQGGTIAEVSSDWWDNDTSYSEMRVLPIGNAEETTDDGQGVVAKIDGVNARVFQNGNLTYVVTAVQHDVPCGTGNGSYPTYPGKNGACQAWTQQVQIVDTSNGGVVLKGSVRLPDNPAYYGGWGWYGCWYYDWFDGGDVVQVNGDALAFRRWYPNYYYSQNGASYFDATDALYVVDLSNADAPSVASVTVTDDTTTWWGNMKAVGSTLYTTHYDWVTKPNPQDPSQTQYFVKYYLDRVDLTDRAHPQIGAKINVPGVLVGASSTDPSILYTIDYRYDNNNPQNDLAVIKIDHDVAYLQSSTSIDGWVGNVIVKNDKAYMSAQSYEWMLAANGGALEKAEIALHQVDLSNATKPVDRKSANQSGWGWLLGVEGDRALVTSGWGQTGIDIYKLSDTAAPAYDQFVHTRGWWTESLSRQNNDIFLSSGYWGVQKITVQ